MIFYHFSPFSSILETPSKQNRITPRNRFIHFPSVQYGIIFSFLQINITISQLLLVLVKRQEHMPMFTLNYMGLLGNQTRSN